DHKAMTRLAGRTAAGEVADPHLNLAGVVRPTSSVLHNESGEQQRLTGVSSGQRPITLFHDVVVADCGLVGGRRRTPGTRIPFKEYRGHQAGFLRQTHVFLSAEADSGGGGTVQSSRRLSQRFSGRVTGRSA